MTDDYIRDEWAAKDAHYAAHPVDVPTAQDGTVLTIGQHVRTTCDREPEGIITELTIRCYGMSGTDAVYEGWGSERREVGRKPQQEVWVFINGRNCIHHPSDIIAVLA